MNDRVRRGSPRKEARCTTGTARFGSRLKDKSRRILKADLPQAAGAYKLARATRKKFVLRLSSAQTRPVVRLGGRSPSLPLDASPPPPHPLLFHNTS